ncbi:hypothetical protein Tco_0307387 [Tanacetum coccineum]
MFTFIGRQGIHVVEEANKPTSVSHSIRVLCGMSPIKRSGDGNASSSKNTGVPTTMEPPRSNLDILDRAARLLPLPDMTKIDPLSFILSQ